MTPNDRFVIRKSEVAEISCYFVVQVSYNPNKQCRPIAGKISSSCYVLYNPQCSSKTQNHNARLVYGDDNSENHITSNKTDDDDNDHDDMMMMINMMTTLVDNIKKKQVVVKMVQV